MYKNMDQEKKDLQVKEAILYVTKTIPDKNENLNEVVEEERIPIRPFLTHPATISVKAGATVPLEPYASARVDIMLSFPCYKEEIDDIYPKVKEFVDQRLSVEYAELKAIAAKRNR